MDFVWSITECFIIILFGYISGKSGLISEKESSGLSKFVTNFSLPALVFKSLAKIYFADVNWSLVTGIFIAKAAMFIVVAVFTLVLLKPSDCAKAGLYGILCTQSNDFAVGYPLLKSLYGGQKPDLSEYVYILAPVQLLLINPFGLIMMELQKHWHRTDNNHTNRGCKMFIHVFRGILCNPVVLMTVVGITWNLIFGPSIPDIMESFLDTLGKAFTASALFLLGLNLVGKLDIIHKTDVLFLPVLLTTVKLIVLPLVMKTTIDYLFLQDNNVDFSEASNFAFLYGTIPTAPTPFIFAIQYKMDATVAATGMAISTMASGPLMYVSASMVQMKNTSIEYYNAELGRTISVVSVLSFPSIIWVLFVFVVDKRWKSITHRCTILLLIGQLITAIAGFLWRDVDSNNSFYHFQYVLVNTGLIWCRVLTAILALTLALIYVKGLRFIRKVYKFMLFVAIILVIALMSVVIISPEYPSIKNINPAFEFGKLEEIISMGLLLTSTLVVSACLATQQYFQNRRTLENVDCFDDFIDRQKRRQSDGDTAFNGDNDVRSITQDCSEIELPVEEDQRDLFNATNEEEALTEACSLLSNNFKQKDAFEYFEIKAHLLLLLVLNLSMFITLMVSVGNLMINKENGVFIELQYFSIIVTFGQGFVSFVIFGIDFALIKQILKKFSRKRIRFLDDVDVRSEETEMCEQFLRRHYKKCLNDIAGDADGFDVDLREFKGSDLSDWILDNRLVSSKEKAVQYCNHLLFAGIIKEVKKSNNRFDESLTFTFIPSENGVFKDN